MTAAGFDEDGGHRFDRDEFTIQLHVAFTLQNKVDFGHFFVVVGVRVGLDINNMQGGGIIIVGGEGTSGKTAGAVYRLNFV